MSETIYFNDKGETFKARWLEEDYPDNPRDENVRTNLGTMVFAKNSKYDLGDEQVDDFSEFFKEQLDEKDFPVRTQGSIIFDFPDVEDAKKDPVFSEFMYINEVGDKLFDNFGFARNIKSCVKEKLYENKLSTDVYEKLNSSIPLRSDGSCENWCKINFETPYGNSDYSEIKNAVEEELAKYGLKITSVHPEEINQLEELSETELYKKWAETKACVIPLSLYEHGGLTVHASELRTTRYLANNRDEDNIFNDGFIYVDKDNPEFLNMLKGEARDKTGNVYNKWTPKSEEEAKKWAEGILKTEIEDYAAYLEGDVHTIEISSFDKATMEWEVVDGESMIYGDSLENNLNSHGFDTSNKLDSTKVFVLENSINPEFKAAVVKEFFESVKEELPDFGNNPKFAAGSVMKQWRAKATVNREETDRVNRWNLKIDALNNFFKEKNLLSEEKLFSFIAETVGVKKTVEKGFAQMNVKDENLHAYISLINNPSRSDNHGIGKLLLVDEQNKRMALLNSPSQVLSKSNIDAKITTLSSAKKVDEKAAELLRYGFKNTEIGNEYLKPYQKAVSQKDIEIER